MSFPNGLHFRTQKHKIEPDFHSFIVTKQNGQRCYGFSLMFYEKAPNKICGAMQTLQVYLDVIKLKMYGYSYNQGIYDHFHLNFRQCM